MTWQRIDENTYIDDTLVTCAEYQLFIDEMREQGKYYQPDHWTSYKFSEGQSREPILGVRISDAGTFAEWLTQRGSREWLFRLPTSAEAREISLPPYSLQVSFGYWITGDNNQDQFAWIGPVPSDVRGMILKLTSTFQNAFDDAYRRALDRAWEDADERDRVVHDYFEGNFAHTFNWLSNRVRARASQKAGALDLALVPARDLANAISKGGRLIHFTLDREEMLNRALDRVVLFDLAREFALDLAIEIALPMPLESDRERWPTSEYAVDTALDLYFDIFALQERIAGRSPAFEGIRLVKERIR